MDNGPVRVDRLGRRYIDAEVGIIAHITDTAQRLMWAELDPGTEYLVHITDGFRSLAQGAALLVATTVLSSLDIQKKEVVLRDLTVSKLLPGDYTFQVEIVKPRRELYAESYFRIEEL